MIEPYETVVRSLSAKFNALGFKLVSDMDFVMTFSNGQYLIDVITERYFHPSLSIEVRDPNGKRFGIGLLRAIFSPVKTEEKELLLRIRLEHELDSAGNSSNLSNQGVFEYVRESLNQFLDFLIAYREKIFAFPNEYEAEYERLDKEFLVSFEAQARAKK